MIRYDLPLHLLPVSQHFWMVLVQERQRRRRRHLERFSDLVTIPDILRNSNHNIEG